MMTTQATLKEQLSDIAPALSLSKAPVRQVQTESLKATNDSKTASQNKLQMVRYSLGDQSIALLDAANITSDGHPNFRVVTRKRGQRVFTKDLEFNAQKLKDAVHVIHKLHGYNQGKRSANDWFAERGFSSDVISKWIHGSRPAPVALIAIDRIIYAELGLELDNPEFQHRIEWERMQRSTRIEQKRLSLEGDPPSQTFDHDFELEHLLPNPKGLADAQNKSVISDLLKQVGKIITPAVEQNPHKGSLLLTDAPKKLLNWTGSQAVVDGVFAALRDAGFIVEFRQQSSEKMEHDNGLPIIMGSEAAKRLDLCSRVLSIEWSVQ